MANPQPDQFTRLSNELLEAVMRTDFTKRQLNILFLIWRCSYGFGKKVAILKKGDFQVVGIYPSDITKELNYLAEAKVIFWDEANDLIAFNKDYDQWRISLSKAAVNGQADFKKILKNQFNEVSKTLNESISKLLNEPVDNSVDNLADISKTLNDEVSKILSKNEEDVSKTLTFEGEKVSKTLTSYSSETSNDVACGDPKEIYKKTNIKETSSKEIAKDEVEDQRLIVNTYEKVFMRLISPFQLEILMSYIDQDGMEPAVIVRAIELAGQNNAKSLKYVTSILDNWRQEKVKTLEDAERASRRHELEKSQSNKSSPHMVDEDKQRNFKRSEYR